MYFGFLRFDFEKRVLQICVVWLGVRVPWQAGVPAYILGGPEWVGFGSAQFRRLNPPML